MPLSYRLLILSSNEQPAWDIPLRQGQQYVGFSKRDDGRLVLVIDLGDFSRPCRDQVDYLNREGLVFHTAPDWAIQERVIEEEGVGQWDTIQA